MTKGKFERTRPAFPRPDIGRFGVLDHMGPDDRSLYRNGFGHWKERTKPHLYWTPLTRRWVCVALVGPDLAYATLDASFREALERMLAKQREWWGESRRDVP